MPRHEHGRTALGAAALVAALGLAGCLDYTFETTVRPDGSGVRVERMEVSRNADLDMSESELGALTLATRERGWTRSLDVDADGDTTWILERRRTIDELSGWGDPSHETLILGTLPAQADTRVGYVRLGDVLFRSSAQVGVARRSDGTSVVSYREAFIWDNAADAIVEFLLQGLDRRLREAYPRLTEAERASVVGYARARIWVAGDEGLFFGENEDEAIARAVEATAEHGVKIIRVRYAGADAAFLREAMADLLAVEDEDVARIFEEMLPGLNLGFNTSVTFRLTLPGRVTTTNAERQDGNTLEWTFSPLDDLMRPVEVFAESVIGG